MTGYLEARRRLEAKIEELIALLDLLDGDPDLENNGDEFDRDLGWNNPHWPFPETPALAEQEIAA